MQGSIEAGKDADFVVWDPDAVDTVTKDKIYFKHKVSVRGPDWLEYFSKHPLQKLQGLSAENLQRPVF